LPNNAAELNLSPQRKRELVFQALLHQFEALAGTRPVLMIFEDAHWVDPSSRELLDLTLERARRLPVLLIATFRPEFQQGWASQPHVVLLALNRLGPTRAPWFASLPGTRFWAAKSLKKSSRGPMACRCSSRS